MGFHAAPTLKQAWDFVQQKSPTADAEGLFDHQVEPGGVLGIKKKIPTRMTGLG
jgi:hypothetical protein